MADQLPRCVAVALTVRARDRPRRTYGASRLGVSAICELKPVRGVGLQILRFDLQCEVDVVAGECLSRVDRAPREPFVVEDFERNAHRNALVGETRADRDGARPEQHGIVERITLVEQE